MKSVNFNDEIESICPTKKIEHLFAHDWVPRDLPKYHSNPEKRKSVTRFPSGDYEEQMALKNARKLQLWGNQTIKTIHIKSET